MIRKPSAINIRRILKVINKASQIYKGAIPKDSWKEPYMSAKMLQKEIEDGVNFFGWVFDANIVGVMGIQYVKDIALVRNAYVLPKHQRLGIGGKILR